MHRTQKMLRAIGALVIVLVVGSYVYTHMRDAFLGPQIVVTYPTHGDTVAEQFVTLRGTAERTATLTINDAQALIEEDGSFHTPLLLAPGYNIIELSAVGRFGREKTDYIELIYNTDTHHG